MPVPTVLPVEVHPDSPVAVPLNPAPGTATQATGAPACASCSTALRGAYCHRCGEKRLGPHDHSLRHWVEHAVESFTHFDLKVPRSLWSLLRCPGAMTADVLAGRRVRWASPFQVFIFANLIYYFAASALGLGTFETPLRYHLDYMLHGDLARRMSEAQAATMGLSMAAYAERFDALAHTLSKTLVVFFVPVFAVLFGLLHLRPRRYGLEHITAGLHFTSLTLLLLLVPLPLVIVVLRLTGGGTGDMLWSVTSSVLLLGYAGLFFRRAYADGGWASLLKATAVPFAFYAALIFVYRPLLFYVVHVLL
jgi:hypothetical protein